jgi:uncharacterized membrane protein
VNWWSYIKPHHVFLILSLYLGREMFVATPPLQAPDEFNHFYRAYQISRGQLLPYTENKRLGGYIPGSIREYALPFSNAATNLNVHLSPYDLVHAYTIPFSKYDARFIDFPNTSLYSPVSYLPQAIALKVSEFMGANVAQMHDSGRIASYACWMLCMVIVIWLMPFGKWLMVFLFLLPMNQFVAMSFSADNVTNMVSLLFVALVLRIAFQSNRISKKQMMVLALLLVLIALAKVVYIGLALLLWIIPEDKFENRKQHIIIKSGLMMAGMLAAYVWSGIVMSYYTPYDQYNPANRNNICLSNCANYFQQKELIFTHPLYFPKVVYRSIFEHPMYFLNGYIGIFGNSDILLTKQLTYLTYILIFIIAVSEFNKVHLSLRNRIIMCTAAFSAFVLLLLSQHLTWDCVGEGIVDLIQGRYLIPLMPALFLCLSNTALKFRYLPAVVVLVYPLILNAYSVTAIKDRYFRDKAFWHHEFYSGAEKKNQWNYFLTSEKGLELNGGISQTDSVSRTGKYSAILDNRNRFSFVYTFQNVEFGDLIEISGWQKGSDVQLVLTGEGKNCDRFYYPSAEVHYRDSAGWGYMQMLRTFNLKCDSTKLMAFVWCADSTKVAFFDDFKFVHRKFSENYTERMKLK